MDRLQLLSMTQDELLNMTVLAESTPGPVAINCATYTGYRRAGVPGAVAATVGVVVAGVVVCWRDRAVAAAHPRAGTITRMARKGQTFFHLDGLGRCMPTGISSPARSNSSLGY